MTAVAFDSSQGADFALNHTSTADVWCCIKAFSHCCVVLQAIAKEYRDKVMWCVIDTGKHLLADLT